MANKRHYPDHYDPLEHIMNTRGLSPYDARNQLEVADDVDDPFQHETEEKAPRSTPLGVKAVEISTYVIPHKGLKEVASPADWKPASQAAARGPQYGDSAADGGEPTYLQPYDKEQLDALVPGIKSGREIVQPVLDDIAQRLADKKLRRARGL